MAKCKHKISLWFRGNGSATNIDDPERRRLVCLGCDVTLPFGTTPDTVPLSDNARVAGLIAHHGGLASNEDVYVLDGGIVIESNAQEDAWPWDPTRPVAGQYEELARLSKFRIGAHDPSEDALRDPAVTPRNAEVITEQTRHDIAASVVRHSRAERPAGRGRDLDAIEHEHTCAAEPDPRDESLSGPVTFREGDATWHDGPGWYYTIDDYPDEGSCGAFASLDEAVAHAKAAGHDVVAASLLAAMRPLTPAELDAAELPPDVAAAIEAIAVATDDEDRKPREPGCECHQEVGDSPCTVHPSEDEQPLRSWPPNTGTPEVPWQADAATRPAWQPFVARIEPEEHDPDAVVVAHYTLPEDKAREYAEQIGVLLPGESGGDS